jgi:DNA (cytosine-5)-methyltransferase 1
MDKKSYKDAIMMTTSNIKQGYFKVETKQLSLFPIVEKAKKKQPKLGRYERIHRQLENENDDPNKIFVSIQENPEEYNFVDLFSGAGGMSQGFIQAGFKPIIGIEINPIASATYQKNFPQCLHICGDIKDFQPLKFLEQLNNPEIHLVVGGPPCQGFSVAGKRQENDPRNYLFQEFIRIVDQIQPWYVVMENVPGILTMKQGKIKNNIFQCFHKIGYTVSVAILETAAFGVPQIRPRAIFIANRFNQKNPYPKAQLLPHEYKAIESVISDLPADQTIPEINHQWTRHSSEYMERLALVAPGESLYKTYADAFKRQYLGKPSMTIKENHGGTHIHPYLNRVISAREMARLQSFPDSFIFQGTMKKAMWQIGNAVPPRLAESIGYALIPYLRKIKANYLAQVFD